MLELTQSSFIQKRWYVLMQSLERATGESEPEYHVARLMIVVTLSPLFRPVRTTFIFPNLHYEDVLQLLQGILTPFEDNRIVSYCPISRVEVTQGILNDCDDQKWSHRLGTVEQ